jgi:hypothetical protein
MSNQENQEIVQSCAVYQTLCEGGASFEEAAIIAEDIKITSETGPISKKNAERFKDDYGLASLDLIDMSMQVEACKRCTAGEGLEVCVLGDAVIKLSA